MSQTDLSKLVLGAFIIVVVVAFPKGIVGMLETVLPRRSTASPSAALLTSHVETAE